MRARSGLPFVVSAALSWTLSISACDSGPPSFGPDQPQEPSQRPKPHAKPNKGPAEKAPPLKLTEADFTSGPSNRDPFQSHMSEFLTPKREVAKIQRKVIMSRYALDELKLIAIVSGRGARPRAMFRDPNGLGVTVRRGDFMSKSAAKVKRILSDRVVVQIEEQLDGKQRMADRVIELHPRQGAGLGAQ